MKNFRLKNKVLFSILAIFVCVFPGCKKKETLVLTDVTASAQVTASADEISPAEPEMVRDKEAAAAQTEEIQAEAEKEGQTVIEVPKIVIHICGAVNNPGVYELAPGDRIYQAVEAAGGFTEEADPDFLNQARLLTDGMQLVIPTREETLGALEQGQREQQFLKEEEQSLSDGLVNINTATEEILCTLPGIGSERAQNIIAYRTEQGSFQRIEDIMNVTGIKEGMFAKIKDKITV